MNENNFLKKLSDKVWITMKARFAAAERMNRFYIFSNVGMTISSAIIISISFGFSGDNSSGYLDKFSNLASLYILVISLLSTQARFDKKAENYHGCGCELTDFNDLLQLYITENVELTVEEKRELIKKYNSIIKCYNLNHSSIDYCRARIMNNDDRNRVGICEYLTCNFRWYLFNCGTFFILIPAAMALLVFVM